MIEELNEKWKKSGLRINIGKSNVMITEIMIDNQKLEFM